MTHRRAMEIGATGRGFVSFTLILLLIANVSCDRTKSVPPAPKAAPETAAVDQGWPRVYNVEGGEVTLQQPQVDEWQNYTTLVARSAVTVLLKGAKDPVDGIIDYRAATATDHQARQVTLYKPEITAVRFPGAPPERLAQLDQVARSIPAAKESTVIALDRVLAYVERGTSQSEGAALNLEPPPIFYSDRDAILISFLGEPRFSPIEGTSLEFALNTNWDIIRDPKGGRVYLLFVNSWLTTDDPMKGTWAPAGALPPDMKRLPKDEVWGRVSQSVPGEQLKAMPRIFVSDRPGEIIVTQGRPQFAAIPGTNLASISNCENALFYHQVDRQFYYLAAGRWFRAADLNGPWTAATKSLPADFASIPKDNPQAWVLASVPGTDEAKDAVMLASIPKTGVVNRSEAKAEAVYDGAPQFEPVEKTSIRYAVNTSNDVFVVGSRYYFCYNAVWFVGSTPNGPWLVADSIPKEIYSIPPTSPKYNVTYVKIYDSTPTTVTTGYTSGYNGEIVAAGIVMFGLGMVVANNSHYYHGYYPPYYWGYGPHPPMPYYGHGHYYASPYGYGYSAHGPYGGAGYGAKYNPSTGIYSRGGYAYGPGGGAAWRTGYNPSTGAMGAQRGGYNAYGSWSQGAVVKGNDWARGGRYSNSQGTAGGYRTSNGGAGVAYSGDNGSGFAVRGKNGNVYAGKDGNVYKRGANGDWSSANGNASANSAKASSNARGGQPTGAQANTSARSSPATAAQGQRSSSGTGRAPSNAAAASSSGDKLKGGFGSSSSTNYASNASRNESVNRATPSTGATGGSSGRNAGASTYGANGGGYAGGAPSAGVQDSLNRDYQARTSGNDRAARSSTSSSGYSGGSAASRGSGSGGGGRRR